MNELGNLGFDSGIFVQPLSNDLTNGEITYSF